MRLAASAGGDAGERGLRPGAARRPRAAARPRRRGPAGVHSALRSLPGYPAGLVGLARADAAGGDLGRAAARLRRAADAAAAAGDAWSCWPRWSGRSDTTGQPTRQRWPPRGPSSELLTGGRVRAGRRGGPVRGRPRLAGARRDAGAPRLACRAERALGGRAGLGADARGPARATGYSFARRALSAGLPRPAVPAPRRDSGQGGGAGGAGRAAPRGGGRRPGRPVPARARPAREARR